MILVIILDILAVSVLIFLSLSRKLEEALPAAAFLLLLFPDGSRIVIPGMFDLTTQRILVVTLFALYLTPGIGPKREDRKRRLPLKYLMVLTIIWMLVSAANSAVPSVSFKAVLSQMLDFFLLFYIVCKTVTRTDTINRILYAMVLAMGLLSILGAVQAYTGWSVVSLFPMVAQRFEVIPGAVNARGLRVAATFPHPILFGTALAIAIPLAFYLLSITKTSGRRVILWGTVMLMFLCIYKTQSRGPWLALILGLGLITLFGYGHLRRYMLVVMILSATVLMARPGVWDTIAGYYYATQNANTALGASYEWRYALYSLALRELGQSFPRALWGYGPASFFYLGLVGEFQGHIVPFQSCDSSIAELLIETGYVGFLITAFLLGAPALFALRNWLRMPTDEKRLCLVFLSSMGAYYFMMTNVACYGWGQQNYFLWMSLAFSMVYPRLVATKAVEGRQDARSLKRLLEPVPLHAADNRLLAPGLHGGQAWKRPTV
jgi:O-antigen ligase